VSGAAALPATPAIVALAQRRDEGIVDGAERRGLAHELHLQVLQSLRRQHAAAGEHHRQRGTVDGQPARQLDAVHRPRHHDVREQQVDAGQVGCDRRIGAAGLPHLDAQRLQQRAGGVGHVRVVLDVQHTQAAQAVGAQCGRVDALAFGWPWGRPGS